jgi:hypothetical protein
MAGNIALWLMMVTGKSHSKTYLLKTVGCVLAEDPEHKLAQELQSSR